MFIAICAFLPNIVNAATTSAHNHKIYVQLNQVALDADFITVNLAQGTFHTMQLNKDEKGYYVLSTELLQAKQEVYRCPECWYTGGSRSDVAKHVREKHRQR